VAALTEAGIDSTLEGPALHEALHRAISLRRACCTWQPIHTGWVVTLHYPESRTIFGLSLEDALAWCLLSVIAREAGDQLTPR
jgi:hypothetical protein